MMTMTAVLFFCRRQRIYHFEDVLRVNESIIISDDINKLSQGINIIALDVRR